MNSLLQLAGMFGRMAEGAYKDELVPVLDEIGKRVKAELQQEIGEYQSGIGPYPAMAELSPVTIDIKLREGLGKGGNPDSPLWATGAFHDDINYQVNRNALAVEVGTNKEYIVYQELGTGKIPPRPIFGPATMRVMPQLMPAIGEAAATGIRGGAWRGLGAKGNTFTVRGMNAEMSL